MINYTYSEIIMENVTPLILDVEEKYEDQGHVHSNDGYHYQHPTVQGHHHHLRSAACLQNILCALLKYFPETVPQNISISSKNRLGTHRPILPQ